MAKNPAPLFFSAYSVNKYKDYGCGTKDASYNYDKAQGFIDGMKAIDDLTYWYWWHNKDTWISDFFNAFNAAVVAQVNDQKFPKFPKTPTPHKLKRFDQEWVDSNCIVFVAGHGSNSACKSKKKKMQWGGWPVQLKCQQKKPKTYYFKGQLCKDPDGLLGGWCRFDTSSAPTESQPTESQPSMMKLGELDNDYLGETGNWGPGRLRYLVLEMCFSVGPTAVVADFIWTPVMNQEVSEFPKKEPGLHMVLGYKSGTSDEFPADERGADFAEKLKKGWTFKQAWWYAVDDTWWLDDEAAIVTWGDSFIDSEDRMDEETLFAGDDNEKYCMEGKYGTAVVSVCFDTHVG